MAHSHPPRPARNVPTALAPRRIVLAVLALVILSTGVGLVLLWPSRDAVDDASLADQFAVEGMTYPTVRIDAINEGECEDQSAVSDDPAFSGQSVVQHCDIAEVTILDGARAGERTTVQLGGSLTASGLRPDDTLRLMSLSDSAADDQEGGLGSAVTENERSSDGVLGVVRNVPLAILAIVFIGVVIAVGMLRGFLALIALGFSAMMVIYFVLPALIAGGSGTAIALVGASAIMVVVLYLAHGVSMRTSAALLGTLIGIGLMAGIAQVAVSTTRLSGLGDETSNVLASMTSEIDFRGLLTCGIIIAGLGVLNDVTITQASSVWELRAAAPGLTRREISVRAMRIGRDHIASAIYTIVFAYAGAAMSVLILLYLYDQPMLNVLTQEDLSIEAVRTITSGIGLVLAVPVTTWIAAWLLPPAVSPTNEASGARPRLR